MSSLSSFLTRFDELDGVSCESEVESLFRELDELCVTEPELEVGGGVFVAREEADGEGSNVDKVDEEMGGWPDIDWTKDGVVRREGDVACSVEIPSMSPTVDGYSLGSEVKTPSRLFSDTGSSLVCSMCSTEEKCYGLGSNNVEKEEVGISL